MKPKRMSWKIGIIRARASVPLSRRMCRNSLRKMATNELHIASGLCAGRAQRGLPASLGARFGGLLGQRHEDVLEGRRDLAHRRIREAGVTEAGDDVLVGRRGVDDRVHRLTEDRRAQAQGLSFE